MNLRKGMRVNSANYGQGTIVTSPSVGADAGELKVWFDGVGSVLMHTDDLQPVPPPLIKQVDGNYSIEGYELVTIQHHGRWRWFMNLGMHVNARGCVTSAQAFDTPEGAALDLWKTMQGE